MKQLLVFLLLLCSASVSAQDVIVKMDGSTILSKVLEVGQEEIKYKRFDNQEGPTYTISKSELQAINYQNGAKDTFSTPIREENRYLPNNQNDGSQQYNDNALLALDYETHKTSPFKRAKTLRTIGWIGGGVLFGVGLGILISELNSDLAHGSDYIPYYLLMGGGVACTTTFLLIANHQKKKAQQLETSSIIQYDFPLSNGSSLSLGADMLRDRTLGSNTVGLGLRYNF